MVVDEDVVYLAPSTVYRILGRYDLLYRWKRLGRGKRVPEATYPDEVWHVDLMYLWVKRRWYFLVSILDLLQPLNCALGVGFVCAGSRSS